MKYLLVVLAVISSFFVAPPASASGCPATELVFARGTSESPGLGEVGDAFAAALNIPVYAVDYPASAGTDMGDLFGDEFEKFFPNAVEITREEYDTYD